MADPITCPLCGNAGWVIDCRWDQEPTTAELVPCLMPDCIYSGRRIEHLSVDRAGFTRTVTGDGVVRALGR